MKKLLSAVRNLPFATKIALLPATAGVSLVVIGITFYLTVRTSAQLFEEIEAGHYAALENVRALDAGLLKLQRTLQDAVVSADEFALEDAAVIHDELLAVLTTGAESSFSTVGLLEDDYRSYYELSAGAALAMVQGDASPAVYAAIQEGAGLFQDLQQRISEEIARGQSAVATAFGDARSTQRQGIFMVLVIAVLALAVLVLVSALIIRATMSSVREAADGMNALARGDLSYKPKITSTDEIGTVATKVWQVRTSLKAVLYNIEEATNAVREGKLQTRIERSKYDGAYGDLGDNVNRLIDAFVAPIELTNERLHRIASGDIPPPVNEAYAGDFDRIKESLNGLSTTLTEVIEQSRAITAAAKAGECRTVRCDADAFQGVWRELTGGINATLDAIAEPVDGVLETMNAVAQGDLSQRITASYGGVFGEMRDAVNTTAEKLEDVVASIRNVGSGIAVGVSEIAQGNTDLSNRTERQAANLEETSSSVQELTAPVQTNAEKARKACALALEAERLARRGGEVVTDTEQAMRAISESSDNVASITDTIDEIAFQTNLLALNAAVEAARAGDQGRGFAVVANEVQELAGRSASAAKEIKELIEASVKQVESGSETVTVSGATLEEIITSVKAVADLVSEIAEASQEQSASIGEINAAVADLDDMTQRNAALVEEVASASQTMGDQSKDLEQLLAFFRVAV